MIAPGTFHEQVASIRDLLVRYRGLVSTLPGHDPKTGTAAASEAAQLHKEIYRRVEQLPAGVLRDHLTRELYK